jgi:hypothetical protein
MKVEEMKGFGENLAGCDACQERFWLMNSWRRPPGRKPDGPEPSSSHSPQLQKTQSGTRRKIAVLATCILSPEIARTRQHGAAIALDRTYAAFHSARQKGHRLCD